ncbi:MAG: glucoamylase family protein [Anaerolineales bacterium]
MLLFVFLLVSCATPPQTVIETRPPTEAPSSTPLPPNTPTPTLTLTASPPPMETPLPTETPSPTLPPYTIEEVIEYEMQGSFNFFWEQANTKPDSPGYGLIRDRFPGSEGISSIASVGFGLTAYVIGIEKGYITYDEGYERVNKTLDTLLAMDRVEGFYFHFVSIDTGKRAWESEVSSIDTSILLMGVLTAGQYFGGDIQAKAQQIYAEVNWPWFIDPERNMFYMAYRPEKGFEGHWDFYAEQLMLYVLAAGSDTHPIDETAYYTFTRHYAKFGEGQPFIHSWFGSIFTYQFSHAWIDFRDYTDKEGVNWFDNSVEASLAHYNFAVQMQDKFNTLGPNAWGLTASDGPNGYNGLYGAPPSGFDNRAHVIDDTIAPAGAIGSIIFLPDQAKQAMLNYYSIMPLRGPYGFRDAYNLTENWYATDVIGIDKGITLLMLANEQDDLVHQIVMQNENILNGLTRLQITQGD